MKRTLPLLFLAAALFLPVSSDESASGGQEPCTGRVATLECASATPGESCDDSAKYADAAENYDKYYIPETGSWSTVTCLEKNPDTDCDGTGTKYDDYCDHPT